MKDCIADQIKTNKPKRETSISPSALFTTTISAASMIPFFDALEIERNSDTRNREEEMVK